MLVMTSSWSVQEVQVCTCRRPLLLHLPVSCWPITPDHVLWSVPTRALNSLRMMSFSDFGTAAISASSCSYNWSFTSSEFVIVGA